METKDRVALWQGEMTIPTYEPEPAEKLPMFYELRNYQNTKGDIYPLAATEKIRNEKTPHTYQAVSLENQYVKTTVLPELGGRVYEGLDKTDGYDFVYKNRVIKPALIGLCGPWVSGGIEFNWPQHHRPTTYLPVSSQVEENPDGSKTVWMGEIEPKDGTKGMVGITLYPGRSYIQAKVRLYNKTPEVKNFHWWANLAVSVNDDYQLIFPPDIDYITFHYKTCVSRFPVVKGEFAGADFGLGRDVSWVKNVHAPGSFFIFNSNYGFMAGYDHGKEMGTVHIADRHISPGKKFFTWGNGEFGDVWQQNLTDEDGPYIEIMTGCYTDNQPDFTWMQPYETKTFEQYWYPLREMPYLKNAGLEGAVSLDLQGSKALLAFNTTADQPGARYELWEGGTLLASGTIHIAPDQPFHTEVEAGHPLDWENVKAVLYSAQGQELISYQKQPMYFAGKEPPQAHTVPPEPEDVPTVEELYLHGLHIEQYRNPTFDPERYYLEALRRDPLDSRCNLAMGKRELHRNRYQKGEEYFRKSVSRLTMRNPNPYQGEAYYQLGRALRMQGNAQGALDAFQKAAWDGAWYAAAMEESAEVAWSQGAGQTALDYAEKAWSRNVYSEKTNFLREVFLRKLGRLEEAAALCEASVRRDPLYSGHLWEQYRLTGKESQLEELERLMRGDPFTWLDLVRDYMDLGEWEEAANVLAFCPDEYALKHYYQAYLAEAQGASAGDAVARGDACDTAFCNPNTFWDEQVLRQVLERSQHVSYYLGNLYYAHGAVEEAFACWEQAAQKDPNLAPLHRNMALACFGKFGDRAGALAHMEKAFALDPTHPRMLYELVLLYKALCRPQKERLALLEAHSDLLEQRDDLFVEYITLLNSQGQVEKAIQAMHSHSFHTYEGGEGLLPKQHLLSYLLLGRKAWEAGHLEEALERFQEALTYPENYHEGRKNRPRECQVYWHIARVLEAMGRGDEAAQWDEKGLCLPCLLDESDYYKAISLRALGREQEAQEFLWGMVKEAQKILASNRRFDYFAAFPTGVPFQEDMETIQTVKAYSALAMAYGGLGQLSQMEEALETLRQYSVDALWVERICKEAREQAAGK